MNKKTYKTVKDYAAYVGKTEKTIYNWIADKKLKTKKVLGQLLIEM